MQLSKPQHKTCNSPKKYEEKIKGRKLKTNHLKSIKCFKEKHTEMKNFKDTS